MNPILVPPLDDAEKAIWNMTYATTFGMCMDKHGAAYSSTQTAVKRADRAVIGLRLWRENKNPQAGVVLAP